MPRALIPLVAFATFACGPDIFFGDPADAAFDYEFVCTDCGCTPEDLSRAELRRLTEEWRLWDFAFASSDQQGPSPDVLQAVRESDGLIVHEFNVPMVRAVLRFKNWTGPNPMLYRGVTEPDEYPVNVRISFTSYDSTRQAVLLDSLGADVRHISLWQFPTIIWEVTIDDSVIPGLRRREDVIEVVSEGPWLCLNG